MAPLLVYVFSNDLVLCLFCLLILTLVFKIMVEDGPHTRDQGFVLKRVGWRPSPFIKILDIPAASCASYSSADVTEGVFLIYIYIYIFI